jgi:hypothetical protein
LENYLDGDIKKYEVFKLLFFHPSIKDIFEKYAPVIYKLLVMQGKIHMMENNIYIPVL